MQNRKRQRRESTFAGTLCATDPTARADDTVYVRARDLPRLVPLWPNEIETLNRSAHARLLARLRRALRMERQRGLAGHWAYDLARHAQLLRAYRAETAFYLERSDPARALGSRSGSQS